MTSRNKITTLIVFILIISILFGSGCVDDNIDEKAILAEQRAAFYTEQGNFYRNPGFLFLYSILNSFNDEIFYGSISQFLPEPLSLAFGSAIEDFKTEVSNDDAQANAKLLSEYSIIGIKWTERDYIAQDTEQLEMDLYTLYRSEGFNWYFTLPGLDSEYPIYGPDHIVTELRFMSHLAGLQQSAIKSGDTQKADDLTCVQKNFFDNHLSLWIFDLTQSAKEHYTTNPPDTPTKKLYSKNFEALEDFLISEQLFLESESSGLNCNIGINSINSNTILSSNYNDQLSTISVDSGIINMINGDYIERVTSSNYQVTYLEVPENLPFLSVSIIVLSGTTDLQLQLWDPTGRLIDIKDATYGNATVLIPETNNDIINAGVWKIIVNKKTGQDAKYIISTGELFNGYTIPVKPEINSDFSLHISGTNPYWLNQDSITGEIVLALPDEIVGESQKTIQINKGEEKDVVFSLHANNVGVKTIIASVTSSIYSFNQNINVNIIDDNFPPISQVNTLEPITTTTSFEVSWSGTDDLSGIKWYDIQVKNGSSETWITWRQGTYLTSYMFTGQDGHTYYFRSRAVDNADNVEDWSLNPDTYTTINTGTGDTQTTTGTVSETHSCDSIAVTATYFGDSDNDGSAELYYKPSSASSWIYYSAMTKGSSQYTKTISGLAENANYDIYVDYLDFDGVIGTDPIYYQYTINTGSCASGPPSTPILDNPGTTDADGSYRITWSYHTDATYYNLQEDTSSSFLSPTTYTPSVDAKSFTGKGNGAYYYRVQACNGFGCSDWSNTESITVSLGSISDNSYAGNIFGSVFEGDSTTVKDYTNGVYNVKVTGRYYVTSPKKLGVEIYKSGSLIATSVINENTVYYFDNYNLQVFVTSTLYGPPFYGEAIAINTKTASAEVDALPSTISIPQGSTGSVYFDIPSSGGAYDTFFVGGTAKDWVTNPSISTYGTSTNKLSYSQSTGTNIDIAVPSSTPPGTHTLFILASNGDFIENDVGSPVYSVKQVTINVEQANNLPNIPTNPTPQNGAINQPINPTLSWTGGDPDSGDSVTYSVYLDSSSNPTTKRFSSISSSTCSIIGLNYNQQYYWQVVATDNQGASTPGPIWSFNTNSPPTASITSISPNPANYGQTVSFSGNGTDSEGSVVGHNWRSSIDGQLSTSSSFSSSALSDGTHTIYYKVMNNYGGWSNEVSQTLIVFPNIPPIASITSITPNPVIEGQTVSFSGSGTDLDGSVIGHNWRSSINGQLNTSSSFSSSVLSVGTHMIYYKVMDNNNDWSNEMPHILTVDPDVTPPTITINSPLNNTVAGEYTLDISGVAYDMSGVSLVLINGNLVSTDYSAPGEVSFNTSIQLRIGDNEIIITAIDSYNNSGDKTLNVKLIRGAIVEDPGTTITTWTAENFDGFHYDINDGIATEMLMIDPTASTSGDTTGLNAGYRTIDENELSYSTNVVTKYQEYWLFGSYNVINFMGEPYVSLLEGEGLLKILIDSDDKYIVTTGDGIELQEGYVLNVRQVDIDGNKVYIELTKNGMVVDTEIVSLELWSPQLYVYDELSIGGETNVPTIMAGVRSVFRGTDTDLVIIEGIFQTSDTLTSVRIDDTYGNMEVTDNSATHITMKNQVPINLSQGSTVDIMGDIKFRVADDGTVLRFHPMLEMTESGTYEIRGAVVADPDAVGIEWNPVNFAGFYYDLDEDIGTETLTINSSYYRTIDENEIFYSTSSQDKQFAYGNFGHYNVIGFMSDLYFVGYDAVAQDIGIPIIDASQNGADILNINLLEGQNLSRILIDTDDINAVISGEGLELQEGYVLNVSSIDMVNNDAILQLSKDGTAVDTKTVPSGGVYVYDELNLGFEANVPTIIALVGTVFSGTDTDAVTFEGLFQISDTLTSVEPDTTYGIMEITDNSATHINMKNENSIILSRGSIKEIMGGIKFRVADADIIRLYPMIDYRIESPIYDTALPTLTIASPTNDTIVYTSSITITGTAFDDTSIASIAVNGILATGTTSWGVNVPLTEGENTINVVATDIAGNTATATINVTYTIAGLVEIRGSVVEDPGTATTTWTGENFGGFNYDIDTGVEGEGLEINPTASISGNTAGLNSGYRTIDDHELSYFTGVVTKYCKYGFFGSYDAINFIAEPYLTLHAGSAGGGLLKILIDSDDTYIVTTGDGIELQEGYVLNVRQVDIDGNKVFLELTKYGNVVDTEIVEAWVPSPEYFYRYDELSIGDEADVLTIMANVKSVFRGTDTDMVTIEGIFQISDTLTSVGIGDTYGNMEVTDNSATHITMKNLVPIDLSQGSTVDIMGDMKFRVAYDDTVLRFYPMLEMTELGTHEIRGEIVEVPDTVGTEWNPINFAGFYYDLDENIGTETLIINSSDQLSSIDRTINQNELIYSTSTQDKQFAYGNFGHYNAIGFISDLYFVGYDAVAQDIGASIIDASQNGTDILDINFFEGKNLSRILIDTDEVYTVVSGDGLELQEGYVLNVSSIDILNNNTIIILSKNGTTVDTKTVSSGYVYVYDDLDIGGENNVPTIIARIDTVLTDTGTDMVLFKGLFQISDSLTSVDVGDTYGNMKITSNNATSIFMKNNWRISLNKGSIKEIMGDIKFRVADDDVSLRFYPFVDAIIEDIAGNFNTTTIDTTPPVINIISPQNGTTLVTSVITITGTASDASDVALVTVNGEPATGTTNWGADVTLIDGENNITIVSTDDLGNTQSVVLTVYYNPSAVIISMGSAEVPSNSLITIPVSIANATNITGISFDLFYNSSVVSVESIVANNSFTGSSISPNVDNINGTTRVALTNTNLITSPTQTPVIDVTFNVTGDFGSLTNLDLENVVLSNSDFNPDTPASVVDGLITVGINGDLNNNGYVDIGDVAKVAFMVAGKVPEELSADFNDNGYVDIGDAAKIAFYLAGKVSEL